MPVQPNEIDDLKVQLSWYLESFADRSRGAHNVDYYVNGIREMDFQCWLAVTDNEIRACALTIVNDDDLNTVTLTHCAGHDAHTWSFLMGGLRAWAKERGSQRLQAQCRPGWEKLLKHEGFKKTHVILELDL